LLQLPRERMDLPFCLQCYVYKVIWFSSSKQFHIMARQTSFFGDFAQRRCFGAGVGGFDGPGTNCPFSSFEASLLYYEELKGEMKGSGK
jgi:hypothetical protein